MATLFFRTIIMYITIIAVMRFMGKRQIGELQLSELVVTILISELAAVPIQDTSVPVIYGVVSILTLISLEIILSFISLKSIKIRKALEGTPSVLIENGTVNQEEMKRLYFSIDDLVESLHQNGALNINQVNTVILETNGKLSVFLKACDSPPTAKDLHVTVSDPPLPLTIISDGRLLCTNLKRLNIEAEKVDTILKKNGYDSKSEIFYMSLDVNEQAVIIPTAGGVKR